MTQAVLSLKSLNKAYGALQVTRNLSIDVLPGEIHAVIGPNGAGKTTLISQISGAIASDNGRIEFCGRNVTHMSFAKRVKAGLCRSFQITTILPEFTVLENVAVACQARAGHSFRFVRNAGNDRKLNAEADVHLETVGLKDRRKVIAGSLSHGEKRALELAIALACKPKLLLLDEPMAGTGPEETKRLVEVLQKLRSTFPMLLVEHDMDAVFSLADRISVLVYGEVIATGTPEEIRTNQKVLEAYLGTEEEP